MCGIFMKKLPLDLPKDVVYGVPIVTVTGQMELCVENYRGLIEYNDSLLRLQTKTGQIKVEGNHIQITSYTREELYMTGMIHSITYG